MFAAVGDSVNIFELIMTGRMMKRLSVGAVFCVLLITCVLLWGPLSNSAVAKQGLTFGFSVDGSGLFYSSGLGEKMGSYLEGQLALPIKVRSFTTEEHLRNWLTRYREVDVAWLSKDSLAGEPDGELFVLAKNLDHLTGLFQGSFVVRQGLSPSLRQQISAVLLSMHENSEGQDLLTTIEVSRFVPSHGEVKRWESPSLGQSARKLSSPPKKTGELQSQENKELSVEVSEATIEKEVSVPVAVPLSMEPLSVQPLVSDIPSDAEVAEAGAVTVIPVDTDDEPLQSVLEKQSSTVASSLSIPTTVSKQKEPIALVADSLTYNSEEDSYEAKGDVVLRQTNVELKSESLLWQAATQDAAAEGAVQLNDAGTEIEGESLQYNMSTGQGQVQNGQVFVREGNFRLAGEQIEKQGQVDYFVKGGSFTTCDGEIPDWKFSAEEVDVTVGGYARAKNVWFHVKDVPVLYAPYLMFPVKTERESGLLAPWFGYSNNKGLRTSLAWYQVIDRHMDATLYLDYFSDIGLGKGLEYRYALPKQNNGKAIYHHVTGFDETPDLDYIKWEHRGNLPGSWSLSADVEYTDDKLFFEEFGEIADDYNRDKTVSTVMLSRHWQKLNLVGHARYIKDLNDDSESTLQRLPELGLGLPRYRINDSPFYFGLESYATSFWREKGEDGERLYLRPSVSATFKPGSWLDIVPEVALYERLYNADAEDDESFVPELSLGLATRLVKNFDVNSWGLDRIQHSVEPKVTYTYVPNETQDKLPLFDLADRINRQDAISYALVNRLTARSTAKDGSRTYRELLNLRLSQRYDIDEAENNRSEDQQPFSDLHVELGFRPTRNISLDVDGLIPVYGDLRFQTLNVGSAVNDDVGNSLNVNYTYKGEDSSTIVTDYVNVQLRTPVLKPVYVLFEERYDFREERELEKILGLEYRSKCWSLLLTYRNRYQEEGDDDHEIMVSFVLTGLGENQGFGNGFAQMRP